jgi:hypoxia up-regulated 1
MVQASVKSVVGEDKIDVSVNADESSVLEDVLYGASISPQHRTKEIKVVDLIPYDIQVSYLSQPKVLE